MSSAPKTTLPKIDHQGEPMPDATMTDSSVKVNVTESGGIIALGILFFIVLLALLRAQRRERKLLRELVELYKNNNSIN